MSDPRPLTSQPIHTTWRSYIAEIPAWSIVGFAMVVSFWTQVGQATHHDFAYWEALVFAATTDAGTIACLFLAREGYHRGTPTWGAWILSIVCAVTSIEANVIEGIVHRDWLAVQWHVFMPAIALGLWYWLLHGRHRRWTIREREGDRSQDDQEGDPDPGWNPSLDPSGQSSPRLPARAEVRRLLRRNPDATPDHVVRRTGVSIRRARQLLQEERQPHLVEADASEDER